MLLEFTEGLVAWEIAILAVISLAVGVLGGMVGLALGTMRLPAMLLIGMEAGVAGGTNILVSTLSAMVGGFRHLREGRVDWRIVLYLGGACHRGGLHRRIRCFACPCWSLGAGGWHLRCLAGY